MPKTMRPAERMEAFWAGDRPDRVPFTVYGCFCPDLRDPRWRRLFDLGLIPTLHLWPIEWKCTGDVEFLEKDYEEGGLHCHRSTIRTPVGEIYSLHANGWQQKYMLVTAHDYGVMTYVVEHQQPLPAYERYVEQAKGFECGVCISCVGRTPIQRILVDWAGLEQFSMHLFDYEDAVMTLYQAQLRQYRRDVEIVAGGPGRFVSVGENFTAETMGPSRFAQFHVPVYRELLPILQQAGKIAGTHFDGKLASCKELIANSPIDLIESLTPPPEGDMTLAQARAALGRKLFWSNINVSNYELPPAELRQVILQGVADGSVDGRLFAYEISEDLPANWEQAIPVVLDALKEAAGVL